MRDKSGMPIESVLNTVARGTVIQGKIITKGDIRVEGTVLGSIQCEAKLVVGEHGMVDGDIDAKNAFISGNVKGKVIVRDLLQLQETGKIEGDIFTSKLSVQVGATFTGNCKMGHDVLKAAELKGKEEAKENVVNNTKQPLTNPFVKTLTNTVEANDQQKEASA